VLTYERDVTGFKYDEIEQDLTELGCQGWEAFGRMSQALFHR
jgi:hypothetical protein